MGLMLRRTLGINTKIFGLIFILLILATMIGGVGLWSMNRIGMEMTDIAEENIPLVEKLTEITINQLEQTILYERAIRVGEKFGHDANARTEFSKLEASFKQRSGTVDKTFREAEAIATQGQQDAHTAHARQEFTALLQKLKKLEEEHHLFDQQAFRVFSLIRSAQTEGLEQIEKQVEDDADKLDHELEAIIREVESFTEASVQTAKQHEEQAFTWIAVILIGVLMLGIAIGSLVSTSIRSSLNRMELMAGEVAQTSEELASNNTTQSAGVEEVSASIEEMISTIQDVANNANQVASTAHNSLEQAKVGRSAVQELLSAMDLINDSSSQITDIINVISDIAEQTNLLALNAAIEAARAGEEGKGFAVVADEVRKLAERSAKAAGEITHLIKTSNTRVQDGVKLSTQADSVLNTIVEYVDNTAENVEQISAATEEQAASSNSIKDHINQVTSAIEENSAAAQELASNAENMTTEIQRAISGHVHIATNPEVGPTNPVIPSTAAPNLSGTNTPAPPPVPLSAGKADHLDW